MVCVFCNIAELNSLFREGLPQYSVANTAAPGAAQSQHKLGPSIVHDWAADGDEDEDARVDRCNLYMLYTHVR